MWKKKKIGFAMDSSVAILAAAGRLVYYLTLDAGVGERRRDGQARGKIEKGEASLCLG